MKIIFNNSEYNFDEKKTIKEAFKEEIEKGNYIVAKYNNKIVSLNKEIDTDGKIDLINRTQSEGRVVYIRGLLYIMSKAFCELYPEAYLTVNYQLSNAMFCEVENIQVTDEIIDNVKRKMQEIIDKNLEIREVKMKLEDAKKFYLKENTLRGIAQTDAQKEEVSLYFCEEYYNYFLGVMPISTNFATKFDIIAFGKGFLVKYPSVTRPNDILPTQESFKFVSALREYDELYKLMKINTVYRLNKKIQEGKIKDLILFSDALHENKIADIANKVKEKPNVRMVLIAGPTSSGKTTFAGKLNLALRVKGIKPVTISVDNYFVEREQNPVDENGNYDFECLEALDIDLLNNQLQDLLDGKEVQMPTFNFKTGHKEYLGNTLKLEDDEILILEGIHCLNDELTYHIPKENKFKIYISDLTILNIDYYNRISTTDTRLIRRISRDYKFRGYSALHTLKMWPSVNKGEQKYIFPYQEEADCMFNSSLVYELSVLKDFVMPLLQEIDDSNPEYSEAQRLIELLTYFDSVKEVDLIPNNSLIREFIGGSIYE